MLCLSSSSSGSFLSQVSSFLKHGGFCPPPLLSLSPSLSPSVSVSPSLYLIGGSLEVLPLCMYLLSRLSHPLPVSVSLSIFPCPLLNSISLRGTSALVSASLKFPSAAQMNSLSSAPLSGKLYLPRLCLSLFPLPKCPSGALRSTLGPSPSLTPSFPSPSLLSPSPGAASPHPPRPPRLWVSHCSLRGSESS